ncbi:unnamed protein product [Amoebophrya sp. A120]|nr:unnamed protein product [Amoebophrya sp. A120]|eukprot:GSA120T00008962001.1
MMSVRPLLFSIFCFAGPCLAAKPDAGHVPGVFSRDCDPNIAAHFCAYLEVPAPLHAIFDVLATGRKAPDSRGRSGTDAHYREIDAEVKNLKERSWERFYQLLRRPELQAPALRGASELFREVLGSSEVARTLPKMGFANQLLSYVQPEEAGTNPDIAPLGSIPTWFTKKVQRALDDAFLYFLHLLDDALLRAPVPRWTTRYTNDFNSDPRSVTPILYLDLPGQYGGYWNHDFAKFRIFTRGVQLSSDDLEKLAGISDSGWSRLVVLPDAPNLAVCGRISSWDHDNLYSLALEVQQLTWQATTWVC